MSPPVVASVFTGDGSRGLGKKETDPVVDVVALHAWSLVHGLSLLALDGQLERHAGPAGVEARGLFRATGR